MTAATTERRSARTVRPASRRGRSTRRVRNAFLDLGVVNLIKQVRPRYIEETIADLADSIAALGLAQVPAVAELTPDKVAAYLELFNRALGGNARVEDLVRDPDTGNYFIMIFGHRRTKAVRLLISDGCTSCRKHFGDLSAKKCAKLHSVLEDGYLEIRVFFNPEPRYALDLQVTENTGEQISQADNAETLRTIWEIEHNLDPALTKTEFASRRNQKLGDVQSALAFCELPEYTKDAVRAGTLTFGKAVELARLCAHRFSVDAVRAATTHVISAGYKSHEVAKYVTGQIEARTADAISVEDLFLIDDADTGFNEAIAKLVEVRHLRAFSAEMTAVRDLRRAIELGFVAEVDLSSRPEVKRILRLANELRDGLI